MDFLDDETVFDLHVPAGGVAEGLADEVADEEVFARFAEDFSEARKVLVGLTGREFTGGINLRGGSFLSFGLG